MPTNIGRYEIVSRLGQGGMGSLFLARDPKIGRMVAIKLVRQEFDSPDARQRFAREAQAAGTLRHQNIVTIFDVDEHEGLPFIAMEYIDGETLADIIRRKAPVEILTRLHWIEELCGALAYAHKQGVIHRDIKPANLMVDTEGTLKVLDFGLARRDASTFTQTQTLIGTPNYMSPEQIRGNDIDARSDIFSVGSVLYELLAYTAAFPGPVHQAMHKIINDPPAPIETAVPGLDARVVSVVYHALEKDVDRRYQDLAAMRSDLAAIRQPPAPQQVSGVRTATAKPAASSSRAAGGRSGRFNTDLLHRRRIELIEKKLEEAQAKFDAGLIEKARVTCEEALFVDPHFPAAVRLMSEIAAEVERRQVALWISDARIAMAKGQLDVATARANEALAVQPHSPEVRQLLDAVDVATRQQATARQVQDGLRKARSHIGDGALEEAARAARHVLGLDADNATAAELLARAEEGLEAQRAQVEREKERQAQALADELRKAIEAAAPVPSAHAPQHLDATAPRRVVEKGAGEADETAPDTAALVPRFEPVVSDEIAEPIVARPAASGRPTPASSVVAERAAQPPRRGRMIPVAAVVSIAAVVAAVYFMSGGTAPQKPSITTPAATTRPNTTVTPPPSVRPPAQPPRDATDKIRIQNDDDATEVNQLLLKSQIDAAEVVVQRIRKRDPRYEGLRDLEAAIARAREYERAAGRKPGA
jgi:tetratricopeptide (TPR) repeat protein/predicted Ser/Thr protein kinase